MAGRRIHPFEADLTELGWQYNRECICGGTYKVYYRKGVNELKVLPSRGRFEVRRGVQGTIANMKTLLSAV